MIALDTNVLVRCLTADDPAQTPVARRLLSHEAGVFIARSVLLELEWVLRAAYRRPSAAIHRSVSALCGLPNVHVEQPAQVAQALADFAFDMDFADALHVACAEADEGMWTFDAKMAKLASGRNRAVHLAPPASSLPGED